jgi:hypothetical protein
VISEAGRLLNYEKGRKYVRSELCVYLGFDIEVKDSDSI